MSKFMVECTNCFKAYPVESDKMTYISDVDASVFCPTCKKEVIASIVSEEYDDVDYDYPHKNM